MFPLSLVKFLSPDLFVPCKWLHIEPMVTFTALVNINSTEYLLCFNAKVGLGEILTSKIKFSALQHKKML